MLIVRRCLGGDAFQSHRAREQIFWHCIAIGMVIFERRLRERDAARMAIARCAV